MKKAFPIVLVGIIVLAVLVFIVIVSPKLKPEPKVGLQSEVDVISIPSFFCDYMIELSITAENIEYYDGILNVEFVSENTIKIYSSIKHPFVKLMGRDGKLLKSIAFPEGSWYEEDGMYIYAANPQGTELQNTIPYLLLDDESNKIYRYGDITI